MSGAAELGALGPGALSIVAALAADRICSVRVRSSRPTHLARLFIGRPARDIPLLAERLFSLCGAAHGFAAARAIAAARGETAPAPRDPRALDREGVAETLRASAAMAGETTPALRALLALARETRAREGSALRMKAAAAELGLTSETQNEGALFARLRRDCAGPLLPAAPPDALGAGDDAVVLDGLRREGEAFSAAPRIAGRAPETGAFASHWRETDLAAGALSARLAARMIDLARRLERLAGGEDDAAPRARSAACGAREGFCAVETARGELYHWARLSDQDRIANYAIVAPTEWNFHPAGPFVAALLGARLPRAEAAGAVARLAALLDPCVAFRVEIREAADA